MGAPFNGKNGLIYVGGTELTGANAWTINVTTESAEYVKFGDSWKGRTVGVNDWAGNVTAYDMADEKILFTAATGGVAVALLIYPTRSTLTSYYSGNVIFGMSSDGGMGGNVNKNGDFVGNSTLTAAGFAA